jgi:hypothetical protein
VKQILKLVPLVIKDAKLNRETNFEMLVKIHLKGGGRLLLK